MSVPSGAPADAPTGPDPPTSPQKQPNKQMESTDPLQAALRVLSEAIKQCEVVRPHLKAAAVGKAELDKLCSLLQHTKVVLNVRSDVLTRKTLETSLSAAIDVAVDRISSIVQGSASAAPPGPTPAPASRQMAGTFAAVARTPERPEDRDVVIQLSTGELNALRALERPALRAKVESVLRAIPALSKVPIEFIRISLKGNLQIRARTINDAVLIHRHRDAWVSSLSASGKIHAARYTVAVNFVPTRFDPAAIDALDNIFRWNGDAVSHRQDLVDARWLNPKAVAAGDKTSATMLVSLADPQSASELIFSSCRVKVDDKTPPLPCDTARHIPPPLQCFRCQKYGHHSRSCPTMSDPSTEACARCAGNHTTRSCPCTLSAPCNETRCSHHAPFKCANCGESHKSTHAHCPVRKSVYAAHALRPEFINPYFVADFSPKGVTSAP